MLSEGYQTLVEVRRAKAELEALIVRSLPPFSHFIRQTPNRVETVGLPRGVSVGIGRHRQRYRLAVRISERLLRESPALEGCLDRFGPSVDLKIIGPVRTLCRRHGIALSPHAARPLQIGTCVSHCHAHERISGSVGFYARNPADGNRVAAVSNAHVLKPSDELAAQGPTRQRPDIIQPASRWGGQWPGSRIGEVVDAAPVDETVINRIDTGLARIDDPLIHAALNALPDAGKPSRLRNVETIRGFYDQPFDLISDYNAAGSTRPKLDPNLCVFKFGHMSRWRVGSVMAVIPLDIAIGSSIYHFEEVIEIESFDPSRNQPFGVPGDSGSAVLDGQGRVIGLFAAASRTGGRRYRGYGTSIPLAYAIPIAAILGYFPNLSVV